MGHCSTQSLACKINIIMLLTIRGQNTHLLECTGSENIAELKAKIAVLENLPVGELRLFSAGSPLEDDICVSTLSSATLDVTVPLSEVRSMVLWPVPVRSSTRHLKLKAEKRRRRPDVPSAVSSTTD